MLPGCQTEEQVQKSQEGLRVRTAAPAKNRSRLEVVADVLTACSSPVSKNTILIKANINSVTATYLMAQLIETRLIDTVVDDENRIMYITTKQGIAFLTSYKNLAMMLKPSLVPETRATKDEIGLFV
jgi:predicted transcriptional regulator